MIRLFTILQTHNTLLQIECFVGLLDLCKLLVLTFVLATSHEKALTLSGTFEFQINLARAKRVKTGVIERDL